MKQTDKRGATGYVKPTFFNPKPTSRWELLKLLFRPKRTVLDQNEELLVTYKHTGDKLIITSMRSYK